MNVIVMGCGRVGSDLATALCKDGHRSLWLIAPKRLFKPAT